MVRLAIILLTFTILMLKSLLIYCTGFRPDVVSFFLFLLTLLTTSFAAVSIAFMVGASVRSVGLANVYVGPCYVMMMVCTYRVLVWKVIGSKVIGSKVIGSNHALYFGHG